MERIEIHPGYSISRVIKGGWHLAGGHGAISERQALGDMLQFVDAGITTFDCADIYTGVEELIGKFLRQQADSFISGSLPQVQVHTKFVPDYDKLTSLTKQDIETSIDRSLQRLGVEQIDLVQFHWWDYQFPGYIDAALQLNELQKAGKIRLVGITNFNADKIREMLNAGVQIASNQVQYSVLDRRVEDDLTTLAERQAIPYLCYGTVAGGFLSDRYLGIPDPAQPLENRSLTKYRLIIEEFGSYQLFQDLLSVLRTIANKYSVNIAEIACRYIMQKPMVAGIIVGARNNKHLAALQTLNHFNLDDDDFDSIQQIINQAKGPAGAFYDLERDKTGKHGAIMKYNLNKQ